MLRFDVRHIHKKAIDRLTTWGVLLLLSRHQTPAQSQEKSRIAQARARIEAIANESVDPRTICVHTAQIFAQLFHAQRAELEVCPARPVEGFTASWTSPRESGRTARGASISLPLETDGERFGTLRLHLAFGHFPKTEHREITLLAAEAARVIQSALQHANLTESAANAERLRLAAQIHHGVAQYLANALMRLQLCQRYAKEDPLRAQEFARDSLACMQMAMDAVRSTIFSLRYAGGKAPRLATLIRATMERLRSMTSAEFRLDVGQLAPLSPVIEAGIAVVACEALTNAAKHADAKHISVRLSRSDESITFEVHDDGNGFAYQETLRRTSRWERFGLALMKDQVHRLGGTLEIRSVPPEGTLVRATLPPCLRRPALSYENAEHNPGPESAQLGAS